MSCCQNCIFSEKKNEEFAYCKNFEKCVSNSDKCRKHRANTLRVKN